jgi:hypothetical protein
MLEKVDVPITKEILRFLGFSPVTLVTTVGRDGSTNNQFYNNWVLLTQRAEWFLNSEVDIFLWNARVSMSSLRLRHRAQTIS